MKQCDLRPDSMKYPDLHLGTPEKGGLETPIKPKSHSSNNKKRSTAYSSYPESTKIPVINHAKFFNQNSGPIQNHNQQIQGPNTANTQYLKSASLCQFHK